MLVSNFFIGKILNKIRELNHYDEDDIDMIRYSLQAILWELEKTIILVLLFALMGRLNHFLVTFIALIPIRMFAGGYHSKTSLNCLILTFIAFYMAIILLPLITVSNIGILLLSCFSLFATLLAAPIRTKEKEAIQSKDKDTQKKLTACIITLIWLVAVFIFKTHTYASPVLWIIVLQNFQLLLVYYIRKREMLWKKRNLY